MIGEGIAQALGAWFTSRVERQAMEDQAAANRMNATMLDNYEAGTRLRRLRNLSAYHSRVIGSAASIAEDATTDALRKLDKLKSFSPAARQTIAKRRGAKVAAPLYRMADEIRKDMEGSNHDTD